MSLRTPAADIDKIPKPHHHRRPTTPPPLPPTLFRIPFPHPSHPLHSRQTRIAAVQSLLWWLLTFLARPLHLYSRPYLSSPTGALEERGGGAEGGEDCMGVAAGMGVGVVSVGRV